MDRDTSKESAFVAQFELDFGQRDEVQRRATLNDEVVAPRAGYLVELAGQPISLAYVEFRILCFLSKSPYRAYTKRQIVDAISTEEQPVAEDELNRHITSLRSKLGLFSDYVQTVPYIGYRFKA